MSPQSPTPISAGSLSSEERLLCVAKTSLLPLPFFFIIAGGGCLYAVLRLLTAAAFLSWSTGSQVHGLQYLVPGPGAQARA